MIYFGLLLLALVGGVSVYDYSKSLVRRAEEYAALAAFADILYGEISLFRSSPTKIKAAIEKNGSARIRALSDAVIFPPLADDLPISSADAKRMREYLSELGKSHYDAECKKAREIAELFNKRKKEEGERVDARIRVCRLLYATAVACALILAV